MIFPAPSIEQGKFGNAIFLPNSGSIDDAYISLGRQNSNCLDNMTLCTNGMTLTFWFKAAQQNHDWPNILFSTTFAMYMKRYQGKLELVTHISNGTHRIDFHDATTPRVTMRKWHLVAFTYSQSKFKFYYDGCEVTTEPSIIQKSPIIRDFTLGCKDSGENCPRNYYDDLRFWSAARGPRFIHWLWQN